MTDVPQFIQSILFQADIIITNHDTWFPCQFAFRYAEDTQYLDSPFTPYPNNKTITPRFIKIHHHNDSFAKAGCPTSTIDAKVIPATNNNTYYKLQLKSILLFS